MTPDLDAIVELRKAEEVVALRQLLDMDLVATLTHDVVRGLIARHDALQSRLVALEGALRDANSIVSMTRDHLRRDHPECAYTVLGILNDESRRQLVATPDPDSELLPGTVEEVPGIFVDRGPDSEERT